MTTQKQMLNRSSTWIISRNFSAESYVFQVYVPDCEYNEQAQSHRNSNDADNQQQFACKTNNGPINIFILAVSSKTTNPLA